MGPKSKAIWEKWNESKGTILQFPKTKNVKSNSEGITDDNVDNTQDCGPGYVLKSDFDAFQQNMTQMLCNFMKSMGGQKGGDMSAEGLSKTKPMASGAPKGRLETSPGPSNNPDKSDMSHQKIQEDVLNVDTDEEGEFKEDDEEGEDEDSHSQVSSWNYKRQNRDQSECYAESVIDDDQDKNIKVEPTSGKEEKATARFVAALTNAIKDLNIDEAETSEGVVSSLMSTRCSGKKASAQVPFKKEHIELVDKIWDKDPADLGVYKKETVDRYRVTETHYKKYLQRAKLDTHLVHELQRCGIKMAKKPRLPDKVLAPIEAKLKSIEMQGQLGISCAVSQSWLIEHASTQILKLQGILKDCLSEKDYDGLIDKVNIDNIRESLVMAQDGALDTLDLQLREVANATMLRRTMWLDNTSWSDAIKNEVKRFPISGEGSLCGPKLKDTLESLRLTSKALDAAEAVPNVSAKKDNRKRGLSQGGGGGPAKKMHFNANRMYDRGNRGGSHGFSRGRGNSGYAGSHNLSSGSGRSGFGGFKPHYTGQQGGGKPLSG
jgi:hypothetical protein